MRHKPGQGAEAHHAGLVALGAGAVDGGEVEDRMADAALGILLLALELRSTANSRMSAEGRAKESCGSGKIKRPFGLTMPEG